MAAQLSDQAQLDALSEEAAANNLNSANKHPWERLQLERQIEILKQLNSRLHASANIDELTGCPRRNAFIDQLKKWQGKTQAQELTRPAMIDIDNFKLINDAYRDTRGDEALTRPGDALLERLRDQAVAARLGGEEFAIAIPL
jgi:diguanylate cyclase